MRRRIATVLSVTLALTLGSCSAESSNRDAGPTRIDGAEVSNDGTTVTLRFDGGACENYSKVDVVETAKDLKVTLLVNSAEGPCTMQTITYGVTIRLQSPLGNKVLKNSAGQPIKIGSPYPHGVLPLRVKEATFTNE